MTYILGINAYHAGASACLLRDGQLLAAAEEERFRRVKYWAGFPSEAIRYCLDEAGITAYDLHHVGISRNPSANLQKKILFALARRPSLHLLRDRLANAAKVRDPRRALIEALHLDPARVGAQFHNVQHHLAHLASAFFVSPFERAAVLSIDGMGDFVSTMWGLGQGTELRVLGSVNFPHSLGHFYTAISQWLGFDKYGDEGKVMSLPPFGRPVYLDRMRKIVRSRPAGRFKLDVEYFVHHAGGATMTWDDGYPEVGTLYSEKLLELLGPPRNGQATGAAGPLPGLSEQHCDVAASLQAMLEEAEFNLLDMLQQSTGERALCLAGGVALNSVFNGKILPRGTFDQVYIQPAAGDAGTSLGAAYYIHHQLLSQPRCYVMRDAYTGPAFSNDQLAAALGSYQLASTLLDEDELCRTVARLIADGNIVGWFQGRMEWGPRALGNRSILADPRRPEMKEILNARIKHREAFRPFAPSILQEATGEYFEQDTPDPFMVKVYAVRPEKRGVIPAVTHVDGSGRLQTVDRATAPRYWRLIKAFEQLTGVPVLLNTSFNDNEPIVCRPEEAIECFLRTRMDALALGNHLVRKA
jgi:carbamoyltransferase